MDWEIFTNSSWPAIVLAFLLGVLATRWWSRKRKGSNVKVNQEYFKGLNFLLNEEPDKAIEVFIKALEVDSETVELHLALGGLFRRKGQVDRATRIHQNLIARTNLSEAHRLQAIYELAHDYYKAGLLDRAENLFIELQESSVFRKQALEGLCRIYQQEKEWAKAIEVCNAHARSERPNYARQVAHYWCELAQLALQEANYKTTREHLAKAPQASPDMPRARLLQGQLYFEQQDYSAAIKQWQQLAKTHRNLASLVVAQSIECYQQLGDQEGLAGYLKHSAAIPKDRFAFDAWYQAWVAEFGEKASLEHIFELIHNEGLSAPVANYLHTTTSNETLPDKQQTHLLVDLLGQAKNRKIEYTCARCGFDTKAMHWYCANCGEWDSFS